MEWAFNHDHFIPPIKSLQRALSIYSIPFISPLPKRICINDKKNYNKYVWVCWDTYGIITQGPKIISLTSTVLDKKKNITFTLLEWLTSSNDPRGGDLLTTRSSFFTTPFYIYLPKQVWPHITWLR